MTRKAEPNMDVVGVALYVLSWILTIMFLKAGLVKVTSRLFPHEHQQASERFVLCAKVCPTVLFGYTPPPYGYMFVIGVMETLSSILLMLPLKNFHTGIYLEFCVLMALAIYTHGALAQHGKMVVPICLFLACLVLYKLESLTLLKLE